MPKKQRPTEEESIPLAPEVSPPPVALSYELDDEARPVVERTRLESPLQPRLTGHGITPKLTATGWVAYVVANDGRVEILTPMRDGQHVGERKDRAFARAEDAMKSAVARGDA